jgi:hypothetical protein
VLRRALITGGIVAPFVLLDDAEQAEALVSEVVQP